MLMTARDHAGPNPTRLARDNRAEYNRLRLHDQLRRRPARPRKKAEPVERANFSELRDTLLASVKASLTDVAEQRAFDSMVGADSYVGLRASVQRAMLQALCRAPAPIAHARRVVDALAPFERRTQAAIVEAFECHARKGLSLEPLILLLESPLFGSLDESERRHAARLICGPRAGSFSWSGHQALLDQWWLRGLRSMKGALSDDVDSARASWAEFVDQPRIPVYFLQSEAFPGVLLTIIGAPNDPGSLAYARIFFVDEDGQLQVGLKSPVEPVRGGWSEKVDPRGIEYEYRRRRTSVSKKC